VTASDTDTSAGFPDEAFEHLSALETGNFWFESRNRLLVWALRRYFPGLESLLEVGCGTGFVLKAIHEAFPEARLVGTDLSAEALTFARRRVDAELTQLDATQVTFSEEFDVVCAFDVLEHIDDDLAALEALATAARSGGGVVVTVPQHMWLWSAADVYGEHRRRYARREIERKVRLAGLTIMRSTSWVTTLLPAMTLSRLRDRNASEFDPTRELRLPASINRVFRAALDAECIAIERGLNLPVGGSRVVVARKH
jgi:SAM-dependent methyltransferase